MLLAACLALIEQAARGRLAIHWPRFLLVAFLPGVVALAWLAQPSLLSRSLALDEIQRLLLVPVTLWTVSSCLPSPRARRILLIALVVAVAPVAAHAVAQKLAGTLELPIDATSRAASTFGNPVFLAAFLVLTTPFCAAAVLFATGPLRWLAAVATGLALPALFATESRWALLGFGVSIATGILLLAPAGRLRRRLLAGLFVAGVLLAAVSTRILLRPQGHSLIWRDTLRMIASHPWGVGPGQFHVAFLPYASPELLEVYPRSSTIINDAHCEPLQLAADLGWPGLAVVLGSLALLVIAVRRSLRDTTLDDGERPWLVASLAALAGSLAQSLGSPDLRFTVSTLLFATAAGFAASFAPPRLLAIPAGRIGRAALMAVGLLGIWGTAASTHERLQIASLIRPPAPFQPSAAGAARIADLRLAVLDQPDDPERHYQLGVALAAERRYVAAAESFRDAARLSQGLLPAVRSLGIVESLSGQFSESLPHLRAVLDAEPGDTAVRYLVAYSSFGLGDVATAIGELETLLAAAPDHPQARLLLEKLRE